MSLFICIYLFYQILLALRQCTNAINVKTILSSQLQFASVRLLKLAPPLHSAAAEALELFSFTMVHNHKASSNPLHLLKKNCFFWIGK